MAAVSMLGHAKLVLAESDNTQMSARLDAFVPEANCAHTHLPMFSQVLLAVQRPLTKTARVTEGPRLLSDATLPELLIRITWGAFTPARLHTL